MNTPLKRKACDVRSPGSTEPERTKSRLDTSMSTIGENDQGEDMEFNDGLELKYECHDFKDMPKCFATLQRELMSCINKNSTDITALKSRVSELETHKDQVDLAISNISEHDIPDIERRITSLEEAQLHLDLWGRKWNMIIKGISGPTNEPATDTERKVRSFLNNKLKVSIDNLQFQAVHRLKGGPDEKKNIIVRLINLGDKDRIMHGLRNLGPNSGFVVTHDLPPKLNEFRNKLLADRAKLAPAQKKATRLVYLKQPPYLKLVEK